MCLHFSIAFFNSYVLKHLTFVEFYGCIWQVTGQCLESELNNSGWFKEGLQLEAEHTVTTNTEELFSAAFR